MGILGTTAVAALVGSEELDLIRDSLAADEVEVIHASCAEEAASSPVLVILYDADASNSWLDMLQQIRNFRPAAKVIVLSRLADNEMWVQALSNGAYDLLSKPCYPREIRTVVRGALDTLQGHASAA
jgi:DNA-binding NtrC family response regulator